MANSSSLAETPPSSAYLKRVAGPQTGQLIEVPSVPFLIGRGKNTQLCVEHIGVSRNHCTLQYQGGKWVILDLGGVNHTFLDGNQLNPYIAYAVKTGSLISLGHPSDFAAAFIFLTKESSSGTDAIESPPSTSGSKAANVIQNDVICKIPTLQKVEVSDNEKSPAPKQQRIENPTFLPKVIFQTNNDNLPISSKQPANNTGDSPTSSEQPVNNTRDILTSSKQLVNNNRNIPTSSKQQANNIRNSLTSSQQPTSNTTNFPTSSQQPANTTRHFPISSKHAVNNFDNRKTHRKQPDSEDDVSDCSISSLDSLNTRIKKMRKRHTMSSPASDYPNVKKRKAPMQGPSSSGRHLFNIPSASALLYKNSSSTSTNFSVEQLFKNSQPHQETEEDNDSFENSESLLNENLKQTEYDEQEHCKKYSPVKVDASQSNQTSSQASEHQKNTCSVSIEDSVQYLENKLKTKMEKKNTELHKCKDECKAHKLEMEELQILGTKTSREVLQSFEDDLICTICTEIFVKPRNVDCGHTFCSDCIEKWRKKNKTCPMCRLPITHVVPQLLAANIIDTYYKKLGEPYISKREELVQQREAMKEQKKNQHRKSKKRERRARNRNPVVVRPASPPVDVRRAPPPVDVRPSQPPVVAWPAVPTRTLHSTTPQNHRSPLAVSSRLVTAVIGVGSPLSDNNQSTSPTYNLRRQMDHPYAVTPTLQRSFQGTLQDRQEMSHSSNYPLPREVRSILSDTPEESQSSNHHLQRGIINTQSNGHAASSSSRHTRRNVNNISEFEASFSRSFRPRIVVPLSTNANDITRITDNCITDSRYYNGFGKCHSCGRRGHFGRNCSTE